MDICFKLYVPTFHHNLVSSSIVDVIGFLFKFGSKSFYILKNNKVIGFEILCDGLYKFKLDNVFIKALMTLHHNIEVFIEASLIVVVIILLFKFGSRFFHIFKNGKFSKE